MASNMIVQSERDYQNFLHFRRIEFSNYLWALKEINPTVSFKQNPRPTPAYHKHAVLNSHKIKELIKEISKKQNIPKEALRIQVQKILDEIGYSRNVKVIRWLGLLLTKLCLRVSSGIHVNYSGIVQLKSAMGHCPVIFVPSHRSYADFVIFTYVCFEYGVEIPAIAAGMDFHGMIGVGEMLRNTGAFYLRRTYSDDSLYWTIFKQYVYQLVTKGDLPIEFFIEGTRSRSNKSLVPKYGLINMILKAFFLSEVPDILFVPVNICYDRILEETLYAFELLGMPKPKESTSGFFKSFKIVKEKFGNIYFHVDTPISAKEFFGNKLDRTSRNLTPLHHQELTDNEKRIIPPLAYEIVRRQQHSAVITIFNLIATIFNNDLTKGRRLMDKEELIIEIEYLRELLISLGAFVFETDIRKGIEESLIVHHTLIESVNGHIGLVENKIVLGKVDPDKLKAHALSQDTMTYAIPFVMLQMYCNPVLFHLIDAALIVIILRSISDMNKDGLFEHYHFLRNLFAVDFVIYKDWISKDFDNALTRLLKENLVQLTNGTYGIKENRKLEGILFSSVQPFILTYYTVTEILLKSHESLTEKQILASTQMLIEDAISQHRIFIHPYCLSLDTISNCLLSVTNMEILKKSKRDNQVLYEIDRVKLWNMKDRLEMYIPSFHVIQSFDIFLHIKNKL